MLIFCRHFEDPVGALLRLDSRLSRLSLPFDPKAYVREVEHPPQPGLPNGIESAIYYFVPNSGWGSDKQKPTNPIDKQFVYATDGFGLNLGCPVRLLRALDALASLSEEDQKDTLPGLRNPTQHLASIEELLWITYWKVVSCVRRGSQTPDLKSRVDWSFSVSGFPLFLEAKFRPSDWPRITDHGSFVPMAESFLCKAAPKFPEHRNQPILHVVGITAFQNLDERLLHELAHELETHRHIDAIVFRTFVNMTHVISSNVGIRDLLLELLSVPVLHEYPVNYFIACDIEQRDKRVGMKAKQPAVDFKRSSQVTCWGIKPRCERPFVFPEPDAYRMNIVSRGANGGPEFKSIPKLIWVSKDGTRGD